MKKSNRNARRARQNRNQGQKPAARRRKSTWLFEQLESRLVFSANPVELETVSLSNDTAEGAMAIWLRELEWAARSAASTSGSNSQYSTYSLPNDPYFENQWHLLNVGQEVGNPDFQTVYGVAGEDINVVPVWNMGYTGEGVVVAVIDSGVQTDHPDLMANLHEFLSFNAIDFTPNPNPSLIDPAGFHGTAVAGLIAATGNNGVGGTGVAPGASIVPILFLGFLEQGAPNDALRYAWQQIDITNNSWGPGIDRLAVPLSIDELTTLRDTVKFGRDGLGTIHVFSSGNGAGPAFVPGFESFGNFDSSSYNPWANSRYTIAVGGVDHDGEYLNFDGTFTSYPEAGASVLVVAPTGSNAAQNVADDNGQGSGIWTTDITGDFGANALPDENGFEFDRDFWPDADYTSRFNGTSASAPIASGVIALMLEANPNLTYRDVQEILVRSARQNAQFEVIESNGGLGGPLQNSWQTNQSGNFRNPDSFFDPRYTNPIDALFNPLADPNAGFFPRAGHYETQPALFTNGAGYTVSQGYGSFGEQIGYAHGVIDAELAVKMAEQWHSLNQGIAPNTELTYTTFVIEPGGAGGADLPAAEVLDPEDSGLLIPGAIFGDEGFSEYWAQYFEDDPFVDYDGPSEFARGTYLTFEVPDTQAMNLEWVEVRVNIGAGPVEDLDYLRISLVSPDGTHSELNHYWFDPAWLEEGFSSQEGTFPHGGWLVDPAGDLTTGDSLIWTFSTNRNWGERTSSAPVIDPITGEPLLDEFGQVITRGWELHIENWSDSFFELFGVEIAWHGKPLAEGTQRVQGLIGIDDNGNGEFNYSRTIQTVFGDDLDTIRHGDVVRTLDTTQESFAANMLVEAYRVVGGVEESTPTARFLTGADGNYYFDLVPDEYVIRVTDPLGRDLLDVFPGDPNVLPDYMSEWHITEDWFFAQDHADPDPLTLATGDVIFDPVAGAPVKFTDGFGQTVESGVRNINFLVKPTEILPDQVEINGNVFADVNANGAFDGSDAAAGSVTVFWDANRNGVHDSGELTTQTSTDPLDRGKYTLTIPTSAAGTFAIGVLPQSIGWTHTNPASGVQEVFARPGDVIGDVSNDNINDGDVNFFMAPPNNASPPGGVNLPGSIMGVVYDDLDGDGTKDTLDPGLAGFRVFIDADMNGTFDGADVEAITDSNGSYFFTDLEAGTYRVTVEHDATRSATAPVVGYRDIVLGEGGTVTGRDFGLVNLADRDWGDLPDSFSTLAISGGPSHVVVPGFHLGAGVNGKVDGTPSANADADPDDDGVVIVSNGGVLQPGMNTLEVTVAGTGGLLNGWIDFDGDGDFVNDANEHVFDDVDLNPGTYMLTVMAPVGMVSGSIGARFRWGEEGLGFTGPATIGEVEDYKFDSDAAAMFLVGDYDSDGSVGESDRLLWMSTFGSSLDLRADGNGNGVVDAADYTVLRDHWGATFGSGTVMALSAVSNSVASTAEQSSGGQTPLSGVGIAKSAEAASSVSSFALTPSVASRFAFSGTSHAADSALGISMRASHRNELLDLALASLVDDRAGENAKSEREMFHDDEEEVSELALAVAMEDGPWWSL